MIRLLASSVVSLLANAVALVVGAQVLEDMSLDGLGFVLAAALFTLVSVIIQPFFRQMAIRSVPALLGSTALIATLVSLVVTAAVSDGLSISGGLTWVLATVLVWGVSLIVRLLLPLIIFKKALSNMDSRQG